MTNINNYKLRVKIEVDEARTADAIYKNADGVWLADWDGQQALPLTDDDGDFLEAPSDWEEYL